MYNDTLMSLNLTIAGLNYFSWIKLTLSQLISIKLRLNLYNPPKSSFFFWMCLIKIYLIYLFLTMMIFQSLTEATESKQLFFINGWILLSRTSPKRILQSKKKSLCQIWGNTLWSKAQEYCSEEVLRVFLEAWSYTLSAAPLLSWTLLHYCIKASDLLLTGVYVLIYSQRAVI